MKKAAYFLFDCHCSQIMKTIITNNVFNVLSFLCKISTLLSNSKHSFIYLSIFVSVLEPLKKEKN